MKMDLEVREEKTNFFYEMWLNIETQRPQNAADENIRAITVILDSERFQLQKFLRFSSERKTML